MSNVLLTLALLSAGFTLWQWIAARRFPLGQRIPPAEVGPISVLKPLKGAAPHARAALESWFRQECPASYEILFGVASREDPAWALASELIERHPHVPARLVLCQPLLGPNAKVSTLCHLAPHATHELIVVSDDDVLAPPDLLAQLASTLAVGRAALVSTFYSLPADRTFGNKWEAVATNSDFWSQVLQGNSLQPMNFALGAVMATSRTALRQVGGFEPLLDYLADDYQLGNRLARAGHSLALSSIPVECRSEPVSFAAAWQHQLRWARTIRTCRPAAYFLSILSNATLWPLLFLIQARSTTASILFIAALALRSFTAWNNYRRIAPRAPLFPLLLAPIKDLLQVLLWAAAFLGSRVTWRGERFRVSPGGKLTRLA